jgi:methionyl-tRNA synthetase
MSKEKFYISTALPYVNAKPHVGFALELIQADVLARYKRSLGYDVFFLSGTDENGLKITSAAEKAKLSVREFADKNSESFRGLKKALNVSLDDFIRTTENRHVKAVERFWHLCQKDIYKKKYKGLYCVECEQFLKEKDLVNGLCPEHKIKPELVEEENYFFKLSRHEDQLRSLIESDDYKIIPESRKNEALAFINQGLEDVCISRSTKRAHGWGIDVPGDKSQKFWCWWDAVINYVSALDYAQDSEKFKDFWLENNNKIHCIGKGILTFHALYWPAALLSAGLALPNTLFVHGYITSQGQKMSKSLGNVVSPYELVEKYGTDPVRYFFLREIPPSKDGDFTYEKFEERYSADLAKGLGNLLARVLTLAKNIEPRFDNKGLGEEIQKAKRSRNELLDDFKFNEALAVIWELVAFCDKYIEKEKPWEERDNAKKVIGNCLFALKEIAELLEPFLPYTSKKIVEQLETQKSEALFPRI